MRGPGAAKSFMGPMCTELPTPVTGSAPPRLRGGALSVLDSLGASGVVRRAEASLFLPFELFGGENPFLELGSIPEPSGLPTCVMRVAVIVTRASYSQTP